MGKWFQFQKGYVVVQLCSEAPERFLNLCRNRGIDLWDLSSEDSYICSTSIDDFYAMKPIARKTHIKLKILQRRGLPFWIHRNRKRVPFFLGFVCFMVLLQLASLFIWNISYEGNQKYTEEELRNFLLERGYTAGMRIKEAHCEELEKEIRKAYNDITWVSVMIAGTKMTVKIKENDGYLHAEMQDEEPCSLYAQYSGIIRSMITRIGVPQVQVGDEVEKGQLLVSGIVTVKGEDESILSQRQVHASADIYVEQILNYTDWIPQNYLKKNVVSTRNLPFIQIGHYYLELPNFFWKTTENEMTVTHMQQLCLKESFWLPVYYGSKVIASCTETELKKSEEEMKKEAEKNFFQYLENLQKIGVEIIQNNVTINLTVGGCLAEGTVTVWFPAVQEGELTQ
ncbi:MAG: sporulation protein YqfD [Lachnospiraceae bacterium]